MWYISDISVTPYSRYSDGFCFWSFLWVSYCLTKKCLSWWKVQKVRTGRTYQYRGSPHFFVFTCNFIFKISYWVKIRSLSFEGSGQHFQLNGLQIVICADRRSCRKSCDFRVNSAVYSKLLIYFTNSGKKLFFLKVH